MRIKSIAREYESLKKTYPFIFVIGHSSELDATQRRLRTVLIMGEIEISLRVARAESKEQLV
jgi:hypothetical protein